jgi:hypothetical protein
MSRQTGHGLAPALHREQMPAALVRAFVASNAVESGRNRRRTPEQVDPADGVQETVLNTSAVSGDPRGRGAPCPAVLGEHGDAGAIERRGKASRRT